MNSFSARFASYTIQVGMSHSYILHRARYATVAGYYFKSKQALIDKLRSFVQDENTILEPRNQEIALEAVSAYEKVYSIGTPEQVYVKKNKDKFNNLAMHVKMKSGEEVTVSYKLVATAVGNPGLAAERRKKKGKIESLRQAVSPDILKFKNEKFRLYGYCYCEECGKKINRRNCEVDHDGPNNEFRHIRRRFRDRYAEGDLYAIDLNKFVSYHREKAELRLVCVNCNRTKPKGS